MTPAEELGYKVGDKFRYVGEGGDDCPAGTILTFTEDDRSDFPYFKDECGMLRCPHLKNIEPLNNNQGENTMSEITAKEVRELNQMSEDDRLLMGAGFLDDRGALTESGRLVVNHKTFTGIESAKIKDQMVADVKAINKARAATK